MGSHFHEAEFDGKLTKSELVRKYELLVEEERYEYGNGGYSGTFATLSGIRVLEKTFASRKEASDYVCDNTEKRGPALAVKYQDTHEVFTSVPTFNGKNFGNESFSGKNVNTVSLDENDLFSAFGVGAKSIAVERVDDGWKFVLADQLSERQKSQLKAVLDPCIEENKKFRSLSNEFKDLLTKAGDLAADFTTENLKSLKTVRKELLKTKIKRNKLLAKLKSLDERLGGKLYKTKTEDRGTKWFVGGWCAC